MDDIPKAFSLPEGSIQRNYIPIIPDAAIREAVVNSVMHRNYRVPQPIQVIRYPNRIEVRNAGYSLIAEEYLGKPFSKSRNIKLHKFFMTHNFQKIKAVVFESCAKPCKRQAYRHVLPMGSWLKNLIMKRYNEANDPYVFPANNKYGYVKNHRKSILSIRKRSNVEFMLHDLRRTFASIVNHQLSRSFSLYTIKRLLNHSGDVTAGYIQFGIEDLRGQCK